MKYITEKQFDEIWENSKNDFKQLVNFLGKETKMIVLNNGHSYAIQSDDDLFAVFEQELYNKMTGKTE